MTVRCNQSWRVLYLRKISEANLTFITFLPSVGIAA